MLATKKPALAGFLFYGLLKRPFDSAQGTFIGLFYLNPNIN